MKHKSIIGFFAFTFALSMIGFGQTSPASVFSNAIHCDSNIFVHWAHEAVVNRGLTQAGSPELGVASFGDSSAATGKADNNVVSLGDGGSAVLGFPFPIQNGEGADFAVFENAFDQQFLELAHVEVSSNGIDFIRFPDISNTQNAVQIETFGTLDADQIHLLAGIYPVFYGVPFDLDSLPDDPLLDKNHVRFVKIVDVVGSIDENLGSVDSRGNLINDPWPTPFPSGGFDLDAVGVIHDKSQLGASETRVAFVQIWPNPVKDYLTIETPEPSKLVSYQILSLRGELVKKAEVVAGEQRVDITDLTPGVYVIQFQAEGTLISRKILKQ